MSKRLMPTYLIKFLENSYTGNKPLDFTRVMVTRQFIAKLKELYKNLGGSQPENYTQVVVPKYLRDFFNELEIIEFDDDDISQEKIVPGNLVYPACRIDSIGGMSYKSENLITWNNINDGGGTDLPSGTTFNGVTITYNQNNSITLSGTTTIDYWSVFVRIANPLTLRAGNSYSYNSFGSGVTNYINFNQPTSGTALHNLTEDITVQRIRLYIHVRGTSVNTTITPMLVTGTTAPTVFKEGFTGIRDSAVIAVKSYGANLFDNANTELVAKTFNNSNQNTYSYTGFALKVFNLTIGQTYTINTTKSIYIGQTNNIDNSGNTRQIAAGYSYTFTATTNYLLVTNQFANYYEEVFENLMINLGSTALPYTPYRGLIDTYTVPTAIKSLEGYGQGINSTIYNNVDFASGKYTKKIGKQQNINIDSLSGVSNEVNSFYSFAKPTGMAITDSSYSTNYLCNKYEVVQQYGNLKDASLQNKIISNISNSNNYLCLPAGATIEEAQEAINDAYLYYKLETPVETNITENAPLLEVESGGKVVLENEYNQDVPSEVVTWIKES